LNRLQAVAPAAARLTAAVAASSFPAMTSGAIADQPVPPRSTRPPIVQAHDVRVRFDRHTAVGGVSLSLRGGDLLGLIGPNGAGKTTLLRSLCGLQPLSGGSVHIMGEPLSVDRTDLLSHLGFTSDTPPCYEGMTVRQFLRFIGKGYDLSAEQTAERTAFWLDKVWLAEKADAKIKSLSRGMRQRVGIARTLLPNPQLVVLDEPAAGLDPAGRVQFRQLLCDLRDQGKALIVSSHILADMSDYCTHIGIMSAGRMVQYGTVADVTATASAGGRCRYTVSLAHPVANLAATLSTIEGVTDVSAERDRVTLTFPADAESAAALLAELVAVRRLPVAAFAANPVNLEEAYLRAGIAQVG
jgi:ABC-2 type transport system ATP-binding protein